MKRGPRFYGFMWPISKWPPTEFRPHFSEVGPRQIMSLTSYEMNKTIKPWSPFHGHGSWIFYPTICGTALAWFRSYLTGRTQSVKIHNTTSKPRLLSYGVPQGSVPLLFTLLVQEQGHKKKSFSRRNISDLN